MTDSRRKGRLWESQLAAWFRDHGWEHAEMRSTGMTGSPDILGIPAFCIEAKNHSRERLSTTIINGLDQAVEAAGGPTFPVCIVKRPGTNSTDEALAVMRLADWNLLAHQWDQT